MSHADSGYAPLPKAAWVTGRIRAVLLSLAARSLWHLGLDGLLAQLFAAVIIRHNRRKGTVDPDKRRAILVMSKLTFSDDIAALRALGSGYAWLEFPVSLRLILLGTLIPRVFHEQKKFYPHREEYRAFLDRSGRLFSRVLAAVGDQTGVAIGAILSSGVDVGHEYPWIAAIHALGGKFIALNKESNIYSPQHRAERIALYRRYHFAFDGDAVLFYNRVARDTCVAAGVVPQDRAFVTGCPRVDGLSSLRTSAHRSSRPWILLASFCEQKATAKNALGLWQDVMDAIAGDAALREGTLVKCREPHEASWVRHQHPGVRAVSGPMHQYLGKRPAVMVGWNSVACLDAMIAGVPVLIPWWGDGQRAAEGALLGPHTMAFHAVARSREEFAAVLSRMLAGERVDLPRPDWRDHGEFRAFLEEHHAPLDGKNCSRVLQALSTLLRDLPRAAAPGPRPSAFRHALSARGAGSEV